MWICQVNRRLHELITAQELKIPSDHLYPSTSGQRFGVPISAFRFRAHPARTHLLKDSKWAYLQRNWVLLIRGSPAAAYLMRRTS